MENIQGANENEEFQEKEENLTEETHNIITLAPGCDLDDSESYIVFLCEVCNTYFNDPETFRNHVHGTHDDGSPQENSDVVGFGSSHNGTVIISSGCATASSVGVEDGVGQGVAGVEVQGALLLPDGVEIEGYNSEDGTIIIKTGIVTNTDDQDDKDSTYIPEEDDASCSSEEEETEPDKDYENYSPSCSDYEEEIDSKRKKTKKSRKNSKAKSKNHRRRPKRQLNANNRYSCKVCNKEFKLSNNLAAHERIHTGERPFQCQICNKTFSDPSNFNRHKQSHSGVKRFQCELCKEQFTRLTSLRRHLQRSHGLARKDADGNLIGPSDTGASKIPSMNRVTSIPHTCEVCGKELTTVRSLQRHRNQHLEKTHKCDICNKKFHHQDDLNAHVKIHSSVRPFECEECGFAFTKRNGLNRHMLIHSGVRPHSCEVCGKSFTRKSDLKVHSGIHDR